jgi:hypothetical protein
MATGIGVEEQGASVWQRVLIRRGRPILLVVVLLVVWDLAIRCSASRPT